jgi:superfamily I DNA/RNA helicase
MGARGMIRAVQEAEATKPKREQRAWSTQQEDIFSWFAQSSSLYQYKNLVVRARAGTGKTTTIIEGVQRAPESSILVCAFNKKIADELNSRIKADSPAQAKTLHSVGYQAIRNQWRGMPVASGSNRSDQLTDTVCGSDVPKPIKRLVSLLHTKGRDMLPLSPTVDALRDLAFYFDYVPDDGWGSYDVDYVAESAAEAMHIAATEEPRYNVGIDYSDMIYLPLVWKLLQPIYELVVVDEAQDMTLAQLTIAQRICSGRICVVGDDKQAIYAFRGADSRSLDRLKKELGAAELPLVTTYRCGQTIVKHAQRLVPDIQAGASNPDGVIDSCTDNQLLEQSAAGDFILSRLNAPLVSVTLKLLAKGKRAKMAGRDIGKGIVAVLKRLRCNESTPLEEVAERLAEWERKTTTKFAAYGQNDLVERTRDQAAMLRAFAEVAESTGELMRQIDHLFSDDKEAGTIICSSVHKAKGLETDRVFILMDTLYRRGVTQEEQNIEYVAVTRAKSHLTLVYETLEVE